MNQPRQTASYLSRRLAAAGLRPISHYGQNFLIDLNLIDLIARSAELRKTDVVLEIGTGVGSLTSRLSDAAGAVLSVEIDQNLYRLASEELQGRLNVRLIHGDALRNKNSLRDDLMDQIRDAISRIGEDARFLLVANLPYNVATPIIGNLLHESPPPDAMVVTIQKELADRMVAQPGTKDYGALSVWVQSQCKCEIVRVLPPTVFWPRPKVHSAIIRLDLVPEWRAKIEDLDHFHKTVRSLFFHRRKFLRSVVISAMKGRLDKAAVDRVLHSLGHGETARAEQLSIERIQQLAEALRLAEIDASDSGSWDSSLPTLAMSGKSSVRTCGVTFLQSIRKARSSQKVSDTYLPPDPQPMGLRHLVDLGRTNLQQGFRLEEFNVSADLPNILASRYASDAMVQIWSPANKVVLERELWIAVIAAQKDLGVDVPDGVIDAYQDVIDHVDLASIDARERVTKHDVKARIEEFNALAGHEHVHKGMTSRDLTENVEQLQMRSALVLTRDRTIAALSLVAQRATEYADLAIAGRSHNVPAQVTTIGKRFTNVAEELLIALDRIENLLSRYPLRGIKGPVGTQQDMLDLFQGDASKLDQLDQRIAEQAGFRRVPRFSWPSLSPLAGL